MKKGKNLCNYPNQQLSIEKYTNAFIETVRLSLLYDVSSDFFSGHKIAVAGVSDLDNAVPINFKAICISTASVTIKCC